MQPIIFAADFAVFPICTYVQSPNCREPATQSDMNGCTLCDFKEVDVVLNDIWKTAIATARERDAYIVAGKVPREEMLRNAQRTWITYRDQACLVESTIARGGSLQSLLQYKCLHAKTLNRISDLQYFTEMEQTYPNLPSPLNGTFPR
jgi:uncharacterized protein YecT (DUF1311 family)